MISVSRRQAIVGGSIVAVLGAAVFAMWTAERRDRLMRAMPAWLDMRQPPESLMTELPVLTPEQSWAANRCAPAAASSPGRGAGSRVRREYPATLADSDTSFISGGASARFEVG
jgi:hypothetical protein